MESVFQHRIDLYLQVHDQDVLWLLQKFCQPKPAGVKQRCVDSVIYVKSNRYIYLENSFSYDINLNIQLVLLLLLHLRLEQFCTELNTLQVFSKPGRSQGLLYKHPRDFLFNSLIN